MTARASDSMFLSIDFVRVTNCFYDYDHFSLFFQFHHADGWQEKGHPACEKSQSCVKYCYYVIIINEKDDNVVIIIIWVT